MSATPEQFYKPLKVPRRVKGKGAAIPEDADLLAERQCYFAKLARDKREEDAKLAIELAEKEEEAQGHTFECGCCCDDVVFSKMIQCPEAHLFCITCARKNAEHILGNRGCVSAMAIMYSEEVVVHTLHTHRRSPVWIRAAVQNPSRMTSARNFSENLSCYFWKRSGPRKRLKRLDLTDYRAVLIVAMAV
jgi:hypothetical protein